MLPSRQQHPEDGDEVSIWNVGELSHLDAAVCREDFIEFCRRESFKTYIPEGQPHARQTNKLRRSVYCCSILQTGHITLSSTPDQQLENHSTKYHRQQSLYNSLELLMMDIVVPETCWASNKICNLSPRKLQDLHPWRITTCETNELAETISTSPTFSWIRHQTPKVSSAFPLTEYIFRKTFKYYIPICA